MTEPRSKVLALGGVSVWPGALESSVGWTETHGGVDVWPGSGGEHDIVSVWPAKAGTPRTDIKTDVSY